MTFIEFMHAHPFLVGCSVACVSLAAVIVGAAFAEALGERGGK